MSATTISQAISVILSLARLFKGTELFKVEIKNIKFDKKTTVKRQHKDRLKLDRAIAQIILYNVSFLLLFHLVEFGFLYHM